MWSTIANFKDNLTQIASDVLDSADELEVDGSPRGDGDGSSDPPRTAQHSSNNSYKDPNLKAELEWYRNEVTRLQAAESEIQSLSLKYVALLKDREEELSRITEENGLLKQKLLVSASGDGFRRPESEGKISQLEKTIENLQVQLQASQALQQEQVAALQSDHQQQLVALIGQHKKDLALALHDKNNSASLEAARQPNGRVSIQDPQLKKLESEVQKLQEKEKELMSQLSEKDEAFEKLRSSEARFMSEIKKLEELLFQEKEAVSQVNSQLQRNHDASEAAARQSEALQLELMKASENMGELQKRSYEQESLQTAAVEELKTTVTSLERSNSELLQEKNRLLRELGARQGSSENLLLKDPAESDSDALEKAAAEIARLTERLEVAEKTYASSRLDYETQLEKYRSERDKATRDLARLKQHLLDKELADSEKMDQDSEQIADLQERAESNLVRAVHAEQALSQALSELGEARRHNKDEYRRTSEEIEALQQRLASCIFAIESKDIELSNLQSALGQYYAESEAQERLYVELSASREEISSLTQQLQVANQKIEAKSAEKDAALDKLVSSEQKAFETVQKMQKMEEEVMRLRRALEQSMTRLNNLSSDSDYHVDRRIVIKLLVTYFQRNHSREVLDLMVRMLGFSEEDKRRVGMAQQNAGRGVVRGVLGLPGRFVGGLIGSASSDSLSIPAPSENQSFADLWIDFLLKESEERERREKAEAFAKAEADRGRDGLGSVPTNTKGQTLPEHGGYFSAASAKGSVSRPPSPERPIGHRPSNSFSGFSTAFSSPKEPPYRMDVGQLPSGPINGPVLGSENSDVTGHEFSSISLSSTSASSNSLFSLAHPDAKLPPRI